MYYATRLASLEEPMEQINVLLRRFPSLFPLSWDTQIKVMAPVW